MLISVYNESIDRWEVKEYEDRIKATFESEPPKRPEARKIYEGEYPELPKSMQVKNVPRETNTFSREFLDRQDTDINVNTVMHALKAGQTAYALIEQWIKQMDDLKAAYMKYIDSHFSR